MGNISAVKAVAVMLAGHDDKSYRKIILLQGRVERGAQFMSHSLLFEDQKSLNPPG
jgi:hypothetical protein